MEEHNKEIKASALLTPLISINDINGESQSLVDSLTAGLRCRPLKFIKSLSLERGIRPLLQLNAHLRPREQDFETSINRKYLSQLLNDELKNCPSVSKKRLNPPFSIVFKFNYFFILILVL